MDRIHIDKMLDLNGCDSVSYREGLLPKDVAIEVLHLDSDEYESEATNFCNLSLKFDEEMTEFRLFHRKPMFGYKVPVLIYIVCQIPGYTIATSPAQLQEDLTRKLPSPGVRNLIDKTRQAWSQYTLNMQEELERMCN